MKRRQISLITILVCAFTLGVPNTAQSAVPTIGFRTENPGPFLSWPLPSTIQLTNITRLPDSPWTHNFLGITGCPVYPALIDSGTWTNGQSYPGNRSYILPGVPDSQVKWQNADNGYPFNNAFACYQEHAGTDISANNSTSVLAAARADQVYVVIDSAGDYRVRLRHPNVNGSGQTWYTYYVHMSSSVYAVGTTTPSGGIPAGATLGGVGKGHLHFEVSVGPNYRGTEARNPWGRDNSPWDGCLWVNRSLCPASGSVSYDYNADGKPDLWAISKQGLSNSTEIHIISGANPQAFLLNTSTVLHKTDATFDFVVADYNADGKPDLWAISKQGLSNSTEIHIISGANPQAFLLNTSTVLHKTDENWCFNGGNCLYFASSLPHHLYLPLVKN